MIDYKTLFEFVEKYDEEVRRIFDKLKEADLEAKAGVLHYGYYSTFQRIEWDDSYEKSIAVRYYDYGYDLYDSTTLMIPADILFDDTKIDKWIKSKIDEALEKKEQKRKDAEKEIISLRTANVEQARQLQIVGKDRDYIFSLLKQKEQEAERYKRSAEILIKLKEFAPDELTQLQRLATERKEQKTKPSTSSNNSKWTK